MWTQTPAFQQTLRNGFSEAGGLNAMQKPVAGKYVKKPYTLEEIGIAVKEESVKP
ncbi:hypothetical protein PITCH_A1910049 [uncultured Desulfobacterium sp.]|uniref:Uncharacterized protein n=1 Tax=uncultured Desulfobacterium sp. TaxID=201089 RepID=A0A445MW34_9BACT|nr:hypothetical protein PITCH_A1910049 [uncultured Desulfobacterium sp.]